MRHLAVCETMAEYDCFAKPAASQAASAEERKNLGKRPEELAARFPLLGP